MQKFRPRLKEQRPPGDFGYEARRRLMMIQDIAVIGKFVDIG